MIPYVLFGLAILCGVTFLLALLGANDTVADRHDDFAAQLESLRQDAARKRAERDRLAGEMGGGDHAA